MREISKYASMIYRCGQIYYDEYLTPYHIGCGQQFFLLRIYEKPGISPYELASMGMYDKGTCARALKKLEGEGYIERVVDTHMIDVCSIYLFRQKEKRDYTNHSKDAR